MQILQQDSEHGWVAVGEGQPLEGNRDYYVVLDSETDRQCLLHSPAAQVFRAGPDRLHGILNFGNFVGRADLLDREVEVRHHGKLDDGSFQKMLRDIDEVAAGLPFDFNRPTYLPFDRSRRHPKPILYHLFAYARHIMMRSGRRESLQASFRRVCAHPHRRMEREWLDANVSRARRIEPQTVLAAVQRPHDLVRVPEDSGVRDTALARRLGGLFPATVRTWEPVHSYDTPENRFVKHFLQVLLDITNQFAELMAAQDRVFLDADLKSDVIQMTQTLRYFLRSAFIKEAGQLSHLPLSSSVLQTRSGYREMLSHFSRLSLATAYPMDDSSLRAMLEAKDIAKLYEYWCFFQLVDAVRDVLNAPVEAVRAKSDDHRMKLGGKLRIRWHDGVELVYQPSYSSPDESYSVTLSPDCVLSIGDRRHVFDAKFKLQRVPQGQGDDSATEDVRDALNADIYKMHTYRDALPAVVSATALYPGTEVHFYEHLGAEASTPAGRAHSDLADVTNVNGVGAIPLLPGDDGEMSGALAEFVASILSVHDS